MFSRGGERIEKVTHNLLNSNAPAAHCSWGVAIIYTYRFFS